VGENKKVANGVVALSSAAILAIYGAGYSRTRAAADRFAQHEAERRPHIPAPRAGREALAIDAASPTPEPTPAPAPEPRPVLPPTPDLPPAEAPRSIAVTKPHVPEPTAPQPEPAAPVPSQVAKQTASTPPPSGSGASGAVGLTDTGSASVVDNSIDTTAGADTPAEPAPAPAPAPVPQAPPATTPQSVYKDGTYYGWGTSRHGDIQAAVVIESGRITIARVERCLTRYSCSWITPIPPRILTKQGTTYDYVSGATESSDAFQDAVAEALAQAK
jgi:uncharacterized protein with FMN-binding domain